MDEWVGLQKGGTGVTNVIVIFSYPCPFFQITVMLGGKKGMRSRIKTAGKDKAVYL